MRPSLRLERAHESSRGRSLRSSIDNFLLRLARLSSPRRGARILPWAQPTDSASLTIKSPEGATEARCLWTISRLARPFGAKKEKHGRRSLGCAHGKTRAPVPGEEDSRIRSSGRMDVPPSVQLAPGTQLMHRLHQREHILDRRLRQHAVAEVEDVARTAGGLGQDVRGAAADAVRGR